MLSPANISSIFRFVFWNSGGLGWSIGKKAYLQSGSYWHKSGADSDEPWQVEWEKDVTVKCYEEGNFGKLLTLSTSLSLSLTQPLRDNYL